MTITANQLLNLFTKVEKLGYSYSFHEDEDESGDYEKEYWINKISTISPSYDFESCMYQLFLRFASLEELEGNYVLYSTLKKIDTYQSTKWK
jgi:hypothetical protein